MARFKPYTNLVAGNADIANAALPHGKRENDYERLSNRNKTTHKNVWRSGRR